MSGVSDILEETPASAETDRGHDRTGLEFDMSDFTVPVETWKQIQGYESLYEVSNFGRVKSLRKGIVLKPGFSGAGYPAVGLCRDGKVRTTYVHHLVAAAFIGPRPAGMDICHNNGDMRDSTASNLRYGTRHSNMRDSLIHGTHPSLKRTACAKGHDLTEENTYRMWTKSADGGSKYRDRCKICLKEKSKHDYSVWKLRQARLKVSV